LQKSLGFGPWMTEDLTEDGSSITFCVTKHALRSMLRDRRMWQHFSPPPMGRAKI